MHALGLEGDHQILLFGVVQLVDAMQPGGAKVYISWGFGVKNSYLDFLKPLRLSGCVVSVMWCDVGGWGWGGNGAREGMHFSQ